MMTFLVIVSAFASGLSLVLHAVAPRTKNTFDDKVEAVVDEVLKYLGQIDDTGNPVESTDHVPPLAPTSNK